MSDPARDQLDEIEDSRAAAAEAPVEESADDALGALQAERDQFLAVGTMAVLAIYLRQRGSPESKPVGAAHDETGSTG